MKIKIHCRQCKAESLLSAERVLNLDQAKEVIVSITEIIRRHESHPNHLDFYVFEDTSEKEMKRYIYDALSNRIPNHGHK